MSAEINFDAILKAMNAKRDEWSKDHGYTERDTGTWILNDAEQCYLDGVDDMISVITEFKEKAA